MGETVMVMDVQGRRREGRVKRRWMGSIRHDLTDNRLSGADVQDRAVWSD